MCLSPWLYLAPSRNVVINSKYSYILYSPDTKVLVPLTTQILVEMYDLALENFAFSSNDLSNVRDVVI